MARSAQATLMVSVVVFGFDPDPGTSSGRALNILTVGGRLPGGEVDARERAAEAALRHVGQAGIDANAGRRGRRPELVLVGLGDEPGRGARTLGVWYSMVAPYADVAGRARWSPVGRGLRLDAEGSAAVRVAQERLRTESKTVAGASALLGDVFTGDDLLRLHIALHGGPRSSERTFRRRVQELRDGGVLRSVRESEVPGLRARIARFRSPAGTGGRPPELLRYSGSGGEEETLAGLRARRSA